MSNRSYLDQVPITDLIIALVLLVGVLVVGYGYFNSNMAFFYLGLFTTLGGVIFGIIRIVTRY
jgi:hypothetical protein